VNDEAQIVSYLLGELNEEDRTRLEERFLRDVEYREHMRAVEDDLVDDYVRGELAPRQRERFEKLYTTLPHRARKVELARALNETLRQRPQASRRWTFRYPLAAAAVLVIGLGVWLVIETSRMRPQVQPPQVNQQAPPPEQKPSTTPEQGPAQPTQLSIATFVLPPGLVRDSAAATSFVIPGGTQVVRLLLPLEKGDEYPAYRAELRTASGNSVWKSDAMRPQPDAAGQSVVLDVPADLLRPDRYELSLTGIDKEVTEAIAYYYFSFATN
jgi:anti-sigma factor RsiW